MVMLVTGVLAALVWIPRVDGEARELVMVDGSDFASGDLPAVCAKTGRPAAVGVTIGRSPRPMIPWSSLREPTGLLPLTTEHHERVLAWKRLNQQASIIFWLALVSSFVVDALGGVAPSTWVSGLVDALVLMLAASLVIAVIAKLGVKRLLAEPRTGDTPGTVALRGIHPDFARAVQTARVVEA